MLPIVIQYEGGCYGQVLISVNDLRSSCSAHAIIEHALHMPSSNLTVQYCYTNDNKGRSLKNQRKHDHQRSAIIITAI